jgi:hypothetical protein
VMQQESAYDGMMRLMWLNSEIFRLQETLEVYTRNPYLFGASQV